jgi:hypothetical protein
MGMKFADLLSLSTTTIMASFCLVEVDKIHGDGAVIRLGVDVLL